MFKTIISRLRNTQSIALAQSLVMLQVSERSRALLVQQIRSMTERLNAAEDTIQRRAGTNTSQAGEIATLGKQLYEARSRNSALTAENEHLSEILNQTARRLSPPAIPCTSPDADDGDDTSVPREMIEGLPARAREVAIVAAASRGYRKSIENALAILGTKDTSSLEYHVRLTTQALESSRKTIAKGIEILCGGQENRPVRTLTEFATWRMSQILTVVEASEHKRAAREAFGLHTDFELRTPPRPVQEARIRLQSAEFRAAAAGSPPVTPIPFICSVSKVEEP